MTHYLVECRCQHRLNGLKFYNIEVEAEDRVGAMKDAVGIVRMEYGSDLTHIAAIDAMEVTNEQ